MAVSNGSPVVDPPIEPRDSNPNSYPASALSTVSARESIYEYEVEHGHTYHSFQRGLYVVSNDEDELERMDLHYHTLRLVMREQHWICPLKEPTSILDVGAGTGIWAMDVADDYPDAQVIGIDLSPTQPTNVRAWYGVMLCYFLSEPVSHEMGTLQ